MSGTPQESPLQKAIADLEDDRNNGEDVVDLLHWYADFHNVPLGALRSEAERRWGAPLEEDRIRNADFFASLDKKKEHEARLLEIYESARSFCIEKWHNSRLDDVIAWAPEEFLVKFPELSEQEREPVVQLFRLFSKDFSRCRAIFHLTKHAQPWWRLASNPK